MSTTYVIAILFYSMLFVLYVTFTVPFLCDDMMQ